VGGENMADGLQILASLDVNGSTEIFKKNLLEIAKKLKAMDVPSFVAGLDKTASRAKIQADLNEISKSLTFNVHANVDPNITNNTTFDTVAKDIPKKIFDVNKLEKQGRKYFLATDNLLNDIQKDFEKLGKTDVFAFRNTKGNIDRFTVSLTNAIGEIEKFNFKKSKLNIDGNVFKGFVQMRSTMADNNVGTELQRTIGFLNQIEKQLVRIDNEALHKRNPLKEDTKYYNDYISQLNDTRTKIDNIAKSSQVLSFQQRESIKKLVFELDQYTSKKKVEANVSVLPTQNVDNSKKIALEQLTAMENKYKNVTYATKELQSQYDALRVSLTQLRPLLNSVTDNEGFKDYSAQVQKLKAEFNAFNNNVRSSNAIDNVAQRALVLAQRINTYIATNSNATKIYGENLRTLASQAQNATSAMDVSRTSRQFQMLTSQIKAAGMAGDDLFTRIVNMGKKFVQWYGVSQIFMRAISLIRQAVTNVKDLDSAMVSLKKVTDESSTAYNRFFENAAKSAKDLSVKMTDLIEQTAEWAKLGKSLQSSETLSKASAIYQIVGEVDSKTAVKDLIAAQKAFSLSDNEVMGIVDRMNNLSNKYAVSAANLGAGLKNAAAALALGGSDINKTLALIVGGTEITQDPEKTANAIKILTLRLRGMKGELQALGEEYEDIESVSKIQTQIYNLTSGKVNIYDQNKELKDPYVIMEDISKVWREISQIDQNQLIEITAGKNRSNEVSAVLNSFISGQAQKAYQDAQNSAGSAMAEQEKWANSIEAKLNKVGSSFEYLSSLLVNSEGLKTALDLISGLMDGITSLLKNIGVGKLAMITFVTSMISHMGKFGNALTFNGNSLNFLGKQYNLFNKNLFQTGQAMNYSLGNVKSLNNAIKFYNQDTEKAIKFQQQMRDTNPTSYTQAYIQSLNGAKASLSGYTNFLADSIYKTQGASGAIKTYNTLLKQSPETAGLFAKSMVALNPSLANFMIATDGAAASVQAFTFKAVAAKAASTALSIGISLLKSVTMGLVSLGIGLLLRELDKYITTSKEALANANELSQTFKQQQESLSGLRDQYAELLQSTEDDVTKREKLTDIISQLTKQYEFEADKISTINQLRQEGLDLIDEEMRKKRIEYITDNTSEYKKAIQDVEKDIPKEKTFNYHDPKDVRSEIQDLFIVQEKEYIRPPHMSSQKQPLPALFNVQEKEYMMPPLTHKLMTILSSKPIATKPYFSLENDNSLELLKNLKLVREQMQEIRTSGIGFSETEENLFVEVDKAYDKAIEKNKDKITLIKDFADTQAKVILEEYSKVNESFDDVYTTDKYKDWYKDLSYKILGVMGNEQDAFPVQKAMDDLLDSLKTMRKSNPVEVITDLDKAMQSLQRSQSVFDKISESVTTASEALRNLNQTIDDNKNPEKFFSADEIIKLLDTYPELSNAILQTAYGYKIEQSALDNLKQAKLDEHKIALQTQLDESKSALASAKLKLSAYAQEFKGIQTVAQAKAKLAEMEIKYNNILAQTSSMQKNSFVSRLTGINGFANVVTGGYNAQKSALENYIQAMQNVDDYQGTIDKLQTQINVLGTSFEDIKNDTSDTNDNLNKQKDIVREMQDDMKDAQEKINDLVDLTVDMLKKQKELEKDNLKEQLDGFKKIIDKRKELIDLEKEQHDFENDIAEKNKSVSEIQQNIDNLSLDNSLEANKKRSELNEKLADEKKKLDDFLYDNEVKKRKQALDTEEELYEEKINNQTKMIEEYLSKDAILRQDAINLINSQSQQFYNDLYNYTQTYTEMSEYEFNKLWNSAYNALRSYGNGQIDVLNILAYLDGQLAATEYQLKQIDVQVNAIKNSADSASASLGSMADVAVQKLSNVNQTLASFRDKMSGEIETYNNNKSWSLAVRPDLEYLSKLPKYHTGGLVGGTSQGSEILAKLLTGEVVSTQSQAENFVSKTLPNLFQGAIKLSNNIQQSPNVSININVEGNADDTTINKLKSTIQNVVKDTFSEINGSKRRFGGTLNAIKY